MARTRTRMLVWILSFKDFWVLGVELEQELRASSAARTSTIGGLYLGSEAKHCNASAAVA